MNIPAFRTAFPEFADTTVYPTQQITFWSDFAEAQVRQCVWNNQWQMGVMLFTAHEITLAAENVNAASFDGSPGQQGGIANNKTVGSATIGFDAQSTTEKDAGYWNLTNYGKQYYRFLKIFGAGGAQL